MYSTQNCTIICWNTVCWLWAYSIISDIWYPIAPSEVKIVCVFSLFFFFLFFTWFSFESKSIQRRTVPCRAEALVQICSREKYLKYVAFQSRCNTNRFQERPKCRSYFELLLFHIFSSHYSHILDQNWPRSTDCLTYTLGVYSIPVHNNNQCVREQK